MQCEKWGTPLRLAASEGEAVRTSRSGDRNAVIRGHMIIKEEMRRPVLALSTFPSSALGAIGARRSSQAQSL